jgi:hypothetical protein
MAKYHSRSSFKSLSEIINEEKQFSNLRETTKNYDVVEKFEIIFPELKIIAQAKKIEKKVLFLKVENSVWKSELNLRKNIIAERLNKAFGEELIKTIKFL